MFSLNSNEFSSAFANPSLFTSGNVAATRNNPPPPAYRPSRQQQTQHNVIGPAKNLFDLVRNITNKQPVVEITITSHPDYFCTSTLKPGYMASHPPPFYGYLLFGHEMADYFYFPLYINDTTQSLGSKFRYLCPGDLRLFHYWMSKYRFPAEVRRQYIMLLLQWRCQTGTGGAVQTPSAEMMRWYTQLPDPFDGNCRYPSII